MCTVLGWNGRIIFLLLDSLNTFPPGRFLDGWSWIGLILVGDRCVSCSPPGGGPRVRRRTRFLCRSGSGLNLFRRCGCSPPTGHPGGRRIRRDIRCPASSAHNFTASSVCGLWWVGLFIGFGFDLDCSGSRSSSRLGTRCRLAGAL